MTREEAINYIKENLLDENNRKALETLIPELKKSEDERMKELIIATINLYYGEPLEEEAKQMIAWLEKKSNNIDPIKKFTRDYGNWDYNEKQVNSANKVKLKFKPGDWIVNNSSKTAFLMKNFAGGYYSFEDTKGSIFSPCLPPLEDENHIWTIEDAKDGDILVCKDKPFIYNGKFNSFSIGGYCGIHIDGSFVVEKYAQECNWSQNKDIKPATKEQRELLFKKMYEADYSWDDEKKKLIPIK